MRIASLVARYLLGFVFLVFGLNGFLHFIPMPPPTGIAGQYMGAIFASHFFVVLYLFQIVPGILLLANRYVPLALALLAPVIFNIVCFHVLMAPAGLPVAILVSILWLLVFASVRSAFSSLLQSREAVQSTRTEPSYSAASQTS